MAETRRFVDTNILLYAVSVDPAEARKQEIAADILSGADVCLSVQALQEFYFQATRKTRRDRLDHDEAANFVKAWKRHTIQDQTVEVFDRAIAICQRTQFSYWDSAIIAAATISGCRTLLTEDMQHGQVIDGVRIVNPFL